ncbi:hypothetical protein ADICYQ_1917 [Cyclobacterium qasimii M12-11B]|uniref:Uncharacterized protein n=1 Tax=Cyclobacterium qasimii M12-11B TaxID=641524 RepID=S7WYN9_9BACT|nr:hypothetical protein ADICYQ_1917 [Cyclobacterium qasimii M12-11B]
MFGKIQINFNIMMIKLFLTIYNFLFDLKLDFRVEITVMTL